MENSRAFLDSYKKYINQGWFGGSISTMDLDYWVENFKRRSSNAEFDPIVCAHFLLNSLIFYQDSHMEAIIRSIENNIKNRLNQSEELRCKHRLSDADLEILWNEYKQHSVIVAATKPGDTGSSAHSAARLWRNATTVDVLGIVGLKDAIDFQQKTHVFFVDDFIGTGTQMLGFLEDRLFKRKDMYGFSTVKELIEATQETIDYNVAVFALHETGKQMLTDAIPSLNFYYGDLYTAQYNLASHECILFDLFKSDKDNIISYIIEKHKELDPTNSYALNLPISFQHGCPNNTLSLYYKSSSDWSKLLTETHPRQS